jgi:hypothetical protein
MVHRVDTRTWEAVEDKDNDRILLQSSSELPADLKQDQQESNEKPCFENHDPKVAKYQYQKIQSIDAIYKKRQP